MGGVLEEESETQCRIRCMYLVRHNMPSRTRGPESADWISRPDHTSLLAAGDICILLPYPRIAETSDPRTWKGSRSLFGDGSPS